MIPSYTQKDVPVFERISTWDEFKGYCNNSMDRYTVLLFWVAWHPPCDDFKKLFQEFAKGKHLSAPVYADEDSPRIYGNYLWCNTEKSKELFKNCIHFQTYSNSKIDYSSSTLIPKSRRFETTKKILDNPFETKGVPSIAVYDMCKYGIDGFIVHREATLFDCPEVDSFTEYIQKLHLQYFKVFESTKEEAFERIDKMIKQSPILAFIKGHTSDCENECAELCEYFDDLRLRFNSFNVLSDPEIRQWLKYYTKVNSYPQVFVRGKFIGGINIIKAIMTKDELLEIVPKESVKRSALERMKTITSKNFITVFMKGTPDKPKNEYQSELINCLNDHKFTFGYYDITLDSNLREQMKEYTGCNSYPQVFLNQKFYSDSSNFMELLNSGKALSIIPTTEIVMKPEDKLINLLSQARIVVLIEGEKLAPEAKSSMEMIDFMYRSKIPCVYGNVSLKANPELRKAAISYSKWCDFPQIYYDGKLLGDPIIAMTLLPSLNYE
ncbi:unnamed protein product [Moneuplotes crassus]|uniref:Glutaredoxin domain-containing protein n=1 Tax=Euplotes crassus TaxID=5936 RepID=A0AAD1UKD2_EUPCR|nr:unnamed protein product [Moneuplotes crassus]